MGENVAMLEAGNLMVFYENMLAINNVSLKCERGVVTGVFGANSAGKSTLMYTISGVMLDIKKKAQMRGGERITILGDIKFDGIDILNVKASKRAKMGLILCPERRRIFPESSTLENLRMGAFLASTKQAKKTLEYVFSLFPHLNTRALRKREGGFLSGGEQQMLAIGRALMAQPKFLLLDEPLLGLSPLIQLHLVNAIREIREQTGIGILVAEQYAKPLLPVVDYAYILENGSTIIEDSGKELMNNPDVSSAYFGM